MAHQSQLTVKSSNSTQSKFPIKKACFGTKEYSQNSGICNRCNYKTDCGKADEIRQGKRA